MKTITCIDCDQQFSGETPDAVMTAMLPHYMSDHKDIMQTNTPDSKKEWFAEFNKRWSAE